MQTIAIIDICIKKPFDGDEITSNLNSVNHILISTLKAINEFQFPITNNIFSKKNMMDYHGLESGIF